jgi:predicted secreted hydrolase
MCWLSKRDIDRTKICWPGAMLGRFAVRMAWLAGAFVSVAWAAGPLPDVGQFGGDARGGGFAQVLEPRVFEFPRDHGPHPGYRQEWWYVTGNLDSATGERFGFELTFFRFALAPEGVGRAGAGVPTSAAGVPAVRSSVAVVPASVAGAPAQSGAPAVESAWRTGQIYMAHFAITDVARQRFRFTQKLSRGAVGLAGVRDPPLQVWIDDWSLGTVDSDGTHWHLRAAESGYELTLDAQVLQQPVLNGDKGLSQKSSDRGSASYYYSIPRVSVRGRLLRDGRPVDVTGLAWVDREWGSGALGGNEQGWDWFALQLQDGSSLMFYALRNRDGRRDPHSAGTWIGAAGQSRPLSSDEVQIDVLDYWKNPGGDRYPARWRVRVPTAGIDVEVRPVLANQELTASTRYWEGAVDVTGANAGQKTAGRGYVELVGYAAQ